MLLAGIALGLIAGLLAGGRIRNLTQVRLRWMAALFLAVVVRYGTEAALSREHPARGDLRIPLLVTAYAILLVGTWANRRQPGMSIAFVGILSNAVVIAVNRGYMPVWEPSLVAAGLTPADVTSSIYVSFPHRSTRPFLAHLGPLGDVIPIPLPVVPNVASIGECRVPRPRVLPVRERPPDAGGGGRRGVAAAPEMPEPIPGLVGSARLHGVSGAAAGVAGGVRPGDRDCRRAEPRRPCSSAPSCSGATARRWPSAVGPARRGRAGHPGVVEPGTPSSVRPTRPRSSFSALWTSGLISLFGDRLNQIALGVIVLGLTGSPVAVGFVFLAAALPNLLLGPISGTLVDRWDQKQVMIVSDLLRAAIVLLIPVAAVTNMVLVYPLIFAVTSISIFFRPARESVMPRIVRSEDLLTANSANWLAETLADIVGYAARGSVRGIPGQLDPARVLGRLGDLRRLGRADPDGDDPAGRPGHGPRSGKASSPTCGPGWRFLRSETALLTNTVQAVVAQFGAGS